MKDHQEKETPSAYGRWSHLVTGVLASQWRLVAAHCQACFQIADAALGIFGRSEPHAGEGVGAAPPPMDEYEQLESLAIARVGRGLAPPRMVYSLPYRNRINWARFPEWARPIDPEVFQESGHEG